MAQTSTRSADGTEGFPIHGAANPGNPWTSNEDMTRLVRILAGRILAKLPKGSGIEMSDLVQAGNLGLLQALRTYRPESRVPLAGFAKFRIRGEMLDTVRRNSRSGLAGLTVPRSAGEDDVDPESRISAPPEHSPDNVLADNQRAEILGQELERLPIRYRAVVRLRYAGEFSLREIGNVLSVHESRACQMHRSALERLRRALSKRGVRGLSNLM